MGSIEDVLHHHYARSVDAGNVTFLGSSLEFCGTYPAALLFAWAQSLARKGSSVSLTLPTRDHLSPQAKQSLLESGLLEDLARAGVVVPYHTFIPRPEIVALSHIPSIAEIPSFIERACSDVKRNAVLDSEMKGVAVHAIQTILHELAENAFLHTGGDHPYFYLKVARSSGAKPGRARGMYSVLPAGTPYLDIVLGDLGPGIVKTLGPAPTGFEPVFDRDGRWERCELSLAYAFDFGATRDQAGRLDRIRRIIDDESIDPSTIGSGLYCVLRTVSGLSGQLIVRVPGCILSLAHARPDAVAKATGASALGVRRVAASPGTHYLVHVALARVPAAPHVPYAPATQGRPGLDTKVAEVSKPPAAAPPDVRVRHVLAQVEDTLGKCRRSPGTLILADVEQGLSPRALAVLAEGLRAMNHGRRTVVWLESAASRLAAATTKSASDGRSRSPLIVASPWTARATVLGDAAEDRLSAWVTVGSEGELTLAADVLTSIRTEYLKWLRGGLAIRLRDPAVRLAPGPFLIEGKYYTEIFYHVATATAGSAFGARAALWIIATLAGQGDHGTLPGALAATSPSVAPILHALDAHYGRLGFPRPILITPDEALTPSALILQLAEHKDADLLIVTDVICRGRSIEDILPATGKRSIRAVVAMVDAREGRALGRPFLRAGDAPQSVPSYAIVQESIQIHDHAPFAHPASEDDPAHSGEELVYVVDRRTNAPTVYSRAVRPEIPFLKLLDENVAQTQALYSGHLEYQGKHYRLFLDLPRLYSGLRPRIEAWIRNQVDFVRSQLQVPKPEWRVAIHDPDGSLAWLTSCDLGVQPRPEIQALTLDQLAAPPPLASKKQASQVWLVIVPAISTAETARRAVEYAARHRPAWILLLCVLSRAEASNLTFLYGIREYSGAQFRLSCLTHFPLPAYGDGPTSCPMCAELEHLERLLRTAEERAKPDAWLTRALREKVAAMSPIRVGQAADDSVSTALASEAGLQRARLLAIYSAAGVMVTFYRHLLNTILDSDDAVDRFLEVIAGHRTSADFDQDELWVRLYKTRERISHRARSALYSAVPPFPIGKMVTALVHLLREEFIQGSGQLAARYAESERDLSEICIAILLTRTMPPDAVSVADALAEAGHFVAARALRDAMDIVERERREEQEEGGHALLSLEQLSIAFRRTSEFRMNVIDVKSALEDPSPSWSSVRDAIDRIRDGWRGGIAKPLDSLEHTRVWRGIADRRQLGASFGRLSVAVGRLGMLSRHPGGVEEAERRDLSEARLLVEEIEALNAVIAEALSRLFSAPVWCKATDVGPTLTTTGGSLIEVERSIDRGGGLAFVDIDELNLVWNEIAENWTKYGGTGSPRARLALARAPGQFVLEFGDWFGGTFDVSSPGGMRVIQSFCERYAAGFEVSNPDAAGYKCIRIRLRAVDAKATGARVEDLSDRQR